MSNRQSYVINGETFKTKAALQDRIRHILYYYDPEEYLSEQDEYFMLDVIKHHPDYMLKAGIGIKAIGVIKNPVYTNTRCFFLLRTDDSITDFSYLECLKETPHKARFIRACRASVEPYILNFKKHFFDDKKGEIHLCPYTGESINFIGSHVDHKAPTFNELVSMFIKENAIDISTITINGKGEDNTYKDTFDDKDIEQLWLTYHNKFSVLQIVSKTANLSLLKTTTR